MNKPQNCGTGYCSCIECIMEDDDYVCPACNGSGEGAYDGYTCYKCKGTGGYPKQYRNDDYE